MIWKTVCGVHGRHREKQDAGLAIGGIEDHVHLLLSIRSRAQGLEWQEGYGAFSDGICQVDDTKAYIANQREHHRTTTFQEEYIAFLERHGIEYDPRYVWG